MENQSLMFQKIGANISRYGLVLILLWYGVFKFTATEAEAIKPLIENSPFFNWMLSVMTLQQVSNFIGITEIITAIAIALRPLSAKLTALGSALAVVTFIGTLSFLFTTPGMFKMVEWMYVPNGFILKDLLLLGFSVWSLGEALSSLKIQGNTLT
ncbi:DUF417 family protein [Flammeovirga kamogawensis]|uniref:YkgB family protein n=1 Tax=Flammeovirga kamogawensis TaxID=373891 RepID=A0ABX8GY53_9BACT|nr:DUF417 family protein [Flammeovirga kamogawensis]MBB6458961.1 putative membrane protein YkgB [Flammeovirga kamogawensis]QWG08536.1 YkgB family protein [Flammeovirga kamogawensis]TRX66828.1 DUF417 family protein [Flammeovirga kamogawensis]